MQIVTIGDDVTTIGDSAFYNCVSLTDVYFEGSEEEWNNISIGNWNECLTNATIHFNCVIPDTPSFPNTSVYELKMYSEIPAMTIGVGSSIGAAVQLERNGVAYAGETSYSFVVSNTDVITISDVENVGDGTTFFINGIGEGYAKITVTETISGAIYSTTVQVCKGIITYNADALPSYYDRNFEYNGYISGIYIDEFESTKISDEFLEVSFNAYNTTSIVGAVDIYDAKGNLYDSTPINRFGGGNVTSIKDALWSTGNLIADIATGEWLTYKQSNCSEKTEVTISVPVGGRIEITNDSAYSNTCALYNAAEFTVSSVLLFSDTFDFANPDVANEIAEKVAVNLVADYLKALKEASGSVIPEKILELGADVSTEIALQADRQLTNGNAINSMASFTDACKELFAKADIDLSDLIISCAAEIGITLVEETFKGCLGPYGATLDGMFLVSEIGNHALYYLDLVKIHSNSALSIYFDDAEGKLSDGGVSITATDVQTDLSKSNFVMHSVVLSNESDLTGTMKESLNSISNDYVVRNIYLERDGVISQPGQNVQVSIPVPENYDANRCVLYWVKDDGSLVKMDTTVSGNAFTFTTDHFSYYAIVQLDVLLGDVNGDGKLSAIDARWALQYSAGNRELTETQIAAADANGDGKISAIDARWILQASAGNRVL